MSIAIALDQLHALAIRVLVASRTSPENAVSVADAILAAEADGLGSHGVSRVPFYADQAISGKVNGVATPEVRQIASAVVHVDAHDGFAYPAIAPGLRRGVEVVEETGLAAVAIGRSHHFGVAGHHVEGLARQGLVGLAFGNSPAAIAPWGGSKALFGTNPIAFACPRRGTSPLVVDLSLSNVARGKVMVAEKEGRDIPDDWALDLNGNPTTDPKAALAGTMLPIGGAKGATLALIVEILAAGLTGSNYGFEASSFFTPDGSPPRVGQLFFILQPKVFAGDGFLDRVEALLDAINAQPGTRLPGDRRLAHRAKTRAEGVLISEVLHEDLMRRAERSST